MVYPYDKGMGSLSENGQTLQNHSKGFERSDNSTANALYIHVGGHTN